MPTPVTLRVFLSSLTLVVVSAAFAQPAQAISADPCGSPALSAAADALAAKFDNHQFLFLGSTHGDAKSEEFLACLVTRPAFQQRATDIVTEWASSAHQQLLDRYLLKLEPAPADGLGAVFLDTDSPTLWTALPAVRQTIEALREVNRRLLPKKRIRLIGGNEGIDWARVRTADDLAPYPYKTNLMEHLIAEHLGKTPGNRTLVIYGDAHIHYRGDNFMGEFEAVLGRSKLFVVGTVRELQEAERGYLAAMGNPNKPFFVDARSFPLQQPWPNSLRVNLDEQVSQPLASYIDGLLYLGPERDRDQTGMIPLSAPQKQELERRNALRTDRQQVMRVRQSGKARWFYSHPEDFPARPVL